MHSVTVAVDFDVVVDAFPPQRQHHPDAERAVVVNVHSQLLCRRWTIWLAAWVIIIVYWLHG